MDKLTKFMPVIVLAIAGVLCYVAWNQGWFKTKEASFTKK
jgi:hypothetical protein